MVRMVRSLADRTFQLWGGRLGTVEHRTWLALAETQLEQYWAVLGAIDRVGEGGQIRKILSLFPVFVSSSLLIGLERYAPTYPVKLQHTVFTQFFLSSFVCLRETQFPRNLYQNTVSCTRRAHLWGAEGGTTTSEESREERHAESSGELNSRFS